MKAVLSVVIPVYNADKYLASCIESILAEGLYGLEIILVDDGSTDASFEICKRYSEKYENTRVIHKNNEGPGIARNIGISMATGQYILFVDADDEIKQGSGAFINQVIQEENFDICFLGAERFYIDGRSGNLGDSVYKTGFINKDRKEIMQYLASRPKFPGSACTKIFRTEFLEEHQISFPCDHMHAEDLEFVADAILAADKFTAIDEVVYRYRQSVSESRSSDVVKNYKRVVKFVDSSVKKYMMNGIPVNHDAQCLLSFVAYEYMVLLKCYARLRNSEPHEADLLLQYLKEKRWLMKYAKSKIGMLMNGCVGVLGIQLTTGLIRFAVGK